MNYEELKDLARQTVRDSIIKHVNHKEEPDSKEEPSEE